MNILFSWRDSTEWSELLQPLHLISGWAETGRWLRQEGICLQCRRLEFDPWVGKIPRRRECQPTSVSLPREFHGQRSLVDYSPWARKELGVTD